MSKFYPKEFRLPKVITDYKKNIPDLFGYIWYNLKNHRAKYMKKGNPVHLVDLEELKDDLGANLIGTVDHEGNRLTVNDFLLKLSNRIDGVDSNIKWMDGIKKEVHYLKVTDKKLRTLKFDGVKKGEVLLDLYNKKVHTYEGSKWLNGSSIKETEAFIFITDGEAYSTDEGIIDTADNNVYYGSQLFCLEPETGDTRQLLEAEKIITYSGVKWVPSLITMRHSSLLKVQGGEPRNQHHITKNEALYLKKIMKDSEDIEVSLSYKSKTPIILSIHGTSIDHYLGSSFVSVTLYDDYRGQPYSIIPNGYSVKVIDKQSVRILGIQGNFWLKITS